VYRSHSLCFMPNFHRVHQPLVKLGIDTAAVYAKVGISHRDVEQDTVGLIPYLKILQTAAEHCERPFLGLEIAKMRVTADLGLFGYMISNAVDYRGLLELADKYMVLITPGAVGTLTESGLQATWTYEFPGMNPDLCRQEVELSVMEFIWVTRTALDLPDWVPAEVCFQHNPPADTRPLHEAMTENVTFNHWFNGAVFPREILDLRINDADPRLMNLLQDEVERNYAGPHGVTDLVGKVALMIASGIGKADISSENLARGLFMSRRSLHRRLDEAGTTVRAIRDAVVLRLSKEMLSTTRASVAAIASTLGYSESSAFVRSFKRMTGETPIVYRRRHGPVRD